MMYIRNSDAQRRTVLTSSRAAGAVMLAATVGLSALVPAFADPLKAGATFAHKYKPVYVKAIARVNAPLMLRAPSFQTLVETRTIDLPGFARQDLPGGVHQGMKAVTIGAAAGQRVRFEYRPEGRIILRVGDKSIVTNLLAAQARPMASFVDEGNNALVALDDPATHNGKRGYRPKVARSYIDTQEGYWLLWADAIAEDLFFRVKFDNGDFPHGLTIVDSNRPVTISADDAIEIRGGEPWVAFWKRIEEEPGKILRSDELGLVMTPRNQDDFQAMETLRRVFKWTPVMRLAAESDPASFRTFVRDLEHVLIAMVSTPSLLIEE